MVNSFCEADRWGAVGSAGVPARNNVLYKRLSGGFTRVNPRIRIARPFNLRAGTPALPTALRTQYTLNAIARPEI